MSVVTIRCPKCNSSLKLPNRSLLGKKGKCPKCEHRFVLTDPDEVELKLAEPETSKPAEPMPGTSAKWVPDMAVPTAESTPAAGMTTNELDFASADQNTGSATSRVRRKKKKNRVGPVVFGIGTALFLFSMAGLWWNSQDRPQQSEQRSAPAVNADWEAAKVAQQESNEDARELSPTSGESIPLRYLAVSPDLVLHLRPSEVWGPERDARYFMATLSTLGDWLQNQIRTITGFEPQEIEELTVAVNFGPVTSEPDIVAVVRLIDRQSAFDMQVKRFKATPRPDLPVQVLEGEKFSYMILDPKTFALAPVTASDLLAEAKNYSQQPGVELEVLLEESDRKRPVTLAFDLSKIDTHRKYVFPENMQQIVDEFVLWFGPEVRTVSWSLHLGDELFMETLVHESNESSTLRVERHMKLRMQQLPGVLSSAIRFMQPATRGYREMIGRLPAMMLATSLGTRTYVGPGYVRMVTLLPGKAAGNLAAASLFAWNQSTVTDFTGPAPAVASSTPKLPDTVEGRLKSVPVFVDFRNTPLQEAFSYISDEIKVPIVINGDALKLAGMTQNMPQSYDLGEVPAMKAINTITSNPMYRKALVIVIDESAKSISVTSRAFAEENGLKIYNTAQ